MCGILGGFGKKALTIEEEKWRSALWSLNHRGPDANGLEQGPHYCLAHARLSIQDLSESANQPFRDDDCSLVYNGEIYNHFELRKTLPRASFKTSSDTETLFWGLKHQGVNFLQNCIGMYSGVFLDKKNNKLFIFRDKMGVKPLYIYDAEDSLFFSSEIKAFWHLGLPAPKANCSVVHSYLSFENYPQGPSMFDQVQMLKPGELWTVELDQNQRVVVAKSRIEKANLHGTINDRSREGLNKGFDPLGSTGRHETLEPPKSLAGTSFLEIQNAQSKDPVLQGRRIIENSIKNHLLSDVPVAVYLSGGIDSSLVAAVASREYGGIKGFTGYFENLGGYYDERPLARLVAEKSQIQLEEVPIRPQDLALNFDKIIMALDEPRMGMGSFSQYVVAERTAQDFKVVLTGHGGDEIFAGYPIFKAFWMEQNKWKLPKLLRIMGGLSEKELVWTIYLLFNSIFRGRVDFSSGVFKEYRSNPFAKHFAAQKGAPLMDQLYEYYLDVYLPALLVVEDKISMHHSLESRVPLLSESVVQWGLSQSNDERMRNGQLKSLLKRIAEPYLPQELLGAPKRGFPTPLRHWFRVELKSFVQERLLSQNVFLDEFVSRQDREKLVRGHLASETQKNFDEVRAHKIWILLCLESWSRSFKVENIKG